MMELLSGKNVVVTGCRRGIGHAVVELFAQHRANLITCLRGPDTEFAAWSEKLAQAARVSVTPIFFDLGKSAEVSAGAKRILDLKVPIDGLINIAASISTATFPMTSIDSMREMFEINFHNQMLLSQFVARKMMREKSGSIVNVASSAALDGPPGRLAYASSKAALIAASKVMARELGPYNIRVNALAPGLTQTDMMRESTSEKVQSEILGQTCLKRLAQPVEIAKACLFLTSDLASYVTGQVLRVDGGM